MSKLDMRILLNGTCCVLALISLVFSIWEHDMKQIGAWSSATFGWFLAAVYSRDASDD
jgi:hypothetical protein